MRYDLLIDHAALSRTARSALPDAPVVDDGRGPDGPRSRVHRATRATRAAAAATLHRLADALAPAPTSPACIAL